MLALAGVASGQSARECGRALERLRNDSLREKAWGVQTAAACGMRGVAEEIGEQLIRMDPKTLAASRWDTESFWVGRATLDALIQLRAPLSEAVLSRIYEAYPTEGTMLMLQHPEANQVLLMRAHREQSAGIWVAATNSLVRMAAPGIAAALLTEKPLSHWVWVSDTGDAAPQGVAGSIMSGELKLRLPDGFPPVGLYHLMTEECPDCQMASDGPAPIYLQRNVIEPGGERELKLPGSGYCLPCLRVQYLAALSAGEPDETERAMRAQTSVQWRNNAQQVRAEIAQTVALQEVEVRKMVARLVKSGALKKSELGMTLRIEVHVDDQRSDHSAPLGEYPAVEFRVE